LPIFSASSYFATRPFRRCHTTNSMKAHTQNEVSSMKKARYSDSDPLPEELITLSFDLLNHIHHHDQHYEQKGKTKKNC